VRFGVLVEVDCLVFVLGAVQAVFPLGRVLHRLLGVRVLSGGAPVAHVLLRLSIVAIELLGALEVRSRVMVVAVIIMGRKAHLL